MNELALSDDLNVITAEINSYKQVAGQAIFEIGKRLKHVKENDLVHGEFGKWLDGVGMTHQHANRYMKVVDELGDSNYTSMFNLGVSALYQIATMPEEEREKEHTLSNGETKTLDEMTSRELQEVKRKNKELEQAKQQAEQQAEQAKKSEEIALKKLEAAEEKEPEVIEKEVTKEVFPDHVKREMDANKRQLDFANKQLKQLEEEKENFDLSKGEFDEKAAEKERKKLEWESEKNVLEMKIQVDRFLKDVSITAFRRGAIASSGKTTKEKLEQSVNELKEFVKQMETVLSGRIEIK